MQSRCCSLTHWKSLLLCLVLLGPGACSSDGDSPATDGAPTTSDAKRTDAASPTADGANPDSGPAPDGLTADTVGPAADAASADGTLKDAVSPDGSLPDLPTVPDGALADLPVMPDGALPDLPTVPDGALSDLPVMPDALPDLPVVPDGALPDVPTFDGLTFDGLTLDGPAVDAADGAVSNDASSGSDGAVSEVELWAEGDLTAKTFSDGYAGQTPKKLVIGISRFELLKSANDPTPALVFDYGSQYKKVDVMTSTLVGKADLATIPVAVYTHGRVKLDTIDFDIDTRLHPTVPPIPVEGNLNVVGALSDATIDGTARSKGWALYTFTFFQDFTQEKTLPALPSTAVGTIVETASETSLIFEFDSPMAVMAIPGLHFKATLTLDLFESFRWEDQSLPNYLTQKFDTTQAGASEPVKNVGATDYHVTITTAQ